MYFFIYNKYFFYTIKWATYSYRIHLCSLQRWECTKTTVVRKNGFLLFLSDCQFAYSFCCFTFLNSGILLIFGSANETFFIVHFACLSTSPFGNNKNNTSLQCYAWLPFLKQFPVTTLYTISTFVEEHWHKRSFPNSCFYGVSIRCIVRDRPHKWSALKLKPKSETNGSYWNYFVYLLYLCTPIAIYLSVVNSSSPSLVKALYR